MDDATLTLSDQPRRRQTIHHADRDLPAGCGAQYVADAERSDRLEVSHLAIDHHLEVMPVAKAFRAISWDTIVLIGALVPLTQVIQSSGAADRSGAAGRRRRW